MTGATGATGATGVAGARVTVFVDGRPACTTGQAVDRAPARWKNTAVLRSWIADHRIQPAANLDGRTKLYYPEDLGLPTEDS